MRKIKEMLRLKAAGLSVRQMAASLHLSVGAIAKYLKAAEGAGLSWPLPDSLDETQLEALLFPAAPAPSRFAQPDFHYLHQELKRKGVTLALLWEEYCQACTGTPYQYSQFCHRYGLYARRLKLSMRQDHRAGEKLFVDYSGDSLCLIDRQTGEIRPTQLFIAVLGASSYTYAEATLTQKLPDWIGAHVRAFEFFGAVPALIVPDNLKSAVSRVCWYEPQINPTYAAMAEHYGTAILPARPGKPRDKPKAEAGVLLAQRWINARLRNHTFFNLHELNAAIRALLDRLNARAFQKNRDECRRSLFEALDRPAMLSLPPHAFECFEERKARVNIDYHIEVEKHYYSVPYQLAKEEVLVRITERVVEIFQRDKRVASHPRCFSPGGHTTVTAHMPKAHQKYLEWTPGRLVAWGRQTGPATGRVVEAILANRPHPEQGFRSCLGLLSLSKKYGKERLEAACRRSLTVGAPAYKSIASILKTGLDQHPELFTSEMPLPTHDNVRGADYYI